MEERNIIIYHHNDLDGITSGAVIYEYEKTMGADSIICREVDYTMQLDIDDIDKNSIIYFVDYSFSGDNVNILKSLIQSDYKVIWIDHHASSAKLYNELLLSHIFDRNIEFRSYISTDYCASILCFKWCYSILNNIDIGSVECKPNILLYVNSWDTWKHDMDNDKEFNIGAMNWGLSPSTYASNLTEGSIFTNEEHIGNNFIDDCIYEGQIISYYLDDQNDKLCDQYGFEFNINYLGKDLKCFALNNYGNSTVFGELINYYDIVCLFKYNGEEYVYSLYSSNDTVHCDEIASVLGEYNMLGGGGHPGAAGFQTYCNLLSLNCTIEIKKRLILKGYKITIKE